MTTPQNNIITAPDNRRRRRAAVVVYRTRNGRTEFLLVSRNSNPHQFVLPGGHIDPGETPQQAAQRECYEESGVHINVQTHLSHYNHIKRRGTIKPTRVYLATPTSIAPSPEGRNTRWTPIKDILKGNHNTPNYVLNLLKQAHNRLPKPARAA